MGNKRSKGVTIIGYILAIYGLFHFLGNLLSNLSLYWNNSLWAKIVDFGLKMYPNLRNVGSSSEWANSIKFLMEKLFSEHPSLLILQVVFISFLFFLIFLGGIGVLRLKNEWRKTTIYVFPLLMLAKFIIAIYLRSYIFMTIILGKFANSNKNQIMSGIEKMFSYLPEFIIQDLFCKILISCIVIFYLTSFKVKEQFK